ncbi:MAG: hypothetical protein RIT11_628 [Pseudomonadota bacterium]
MSSYVAISKGAAGLVPPVSLALWRWLFAFLILLPFVFIKIKKNQNYIKKEWKKLLFLGWILYLWNFSSDKWHNHYSNKYGNYLFSFPNIHNFVFIFFI